GKVVLITGASGGMGEEITKILAKKHCKLGLFARRENKLQQLVKECGLDDSNCVYRKCDISKEEDVIAAVNATIDAFGRIDVAILSAGILIPNPIQTFDSRIIKQSMDINFMGIVYSIAHILPIMKKQEKGTIAAISTLPDRRGVPGWGAYGSSKAAISWLMESLRAEAKQRYNINVITIKPGSVLTPMIEDYHRQGAINAHQAAALIVSGIEKEKRIIQFPLSQVLMTRIQDLFPPLAYDLLPIEQSKGMGYPEEKEQE
ncbi:MAG: SDR family oxidoreductase, partial [Candidatus Heimdallarchaeota archaeon]|nr:SDR family oxidoreductase [Candidatus Heimdallarchaeota archaeon]